HPAIRTTGFLTFALAGLSPAEHTSVYWSQHPDRTLSRHPALTPQPPVARLVPTRQTAWGPVARWFRRRPFAFDTSSTVHLRSTYQQTPDGFPPAFSRNAHHPSRCAGAACGGLNPDPAIRVRGAHPHLLCSKAAQSWSYIVTSSSRRRGAPSSAKRTRVLFPLRRGFTSFSNHSSST